MSERAAVFLIVLGSMMMGASIGHLVLGRVVRKEALREACGPCDHEARCGELVCTAGKDGWHRE